MTAAARARLQPIGLAIAGLALLLVPVAAGYLARAGRVRAVELGLLALAAAAAGALAWRAGPAWCATGGVCLSIYSGQWGQMGVPLPIDRVLLLAALVAAALGALGRPNRIAVRPLHWLLALVGAYAVLSAVWVGTLSDKSAFFALLDRLGLVPFAVFLAAPVLFPTARERAKLLTGLVATGVYLGLTALFEAAGWTGLVLPHYIVDPSIGIHGDRARGPFLEAAANGMALYACGVACVIAIFTWKEPLARIVAAAATALCVAGVLFTLTRSVWVGALAATALALASRRRLARFIVPASAAIAIVVWGAFQLVPDTGKRAEVRKNDQLPVWDRENLNAAGLRMLEDRPLVGFGWARSGAEIGAYKRQADDRPLLSGGADIHNLFLTMGVELGVLGAALWLAALVLGVAVPAMRRGPPERESWRTFLIAFAVMWLVVASLTPLSFAFPTLLLWLLAGIVVAGRQGLEGCA